MTTKLDYNPTSFNPATGGHAPGHLRDAFLEAIEAGTRPDISLCGLLWNCTDVLPGVTCDDLDLPAGSTYAKAARLLKAQASN